MKLNEGINFWLEKNHEILSEIEFECTLKEDESSLFNGDSLFSGNLGLVIYHAYYWKVTGSKIAEKRFKSLLSKILERINHGHSSLSSFELSYGLSGLVIVFKQLETIGAADFKEEDFDSIYIMAKDWILQEIIDDDLEYMHGAFGAIFALSDYIIKDPDFLNEIVEVLSLKLIPSSEGSVLYMINKYVPDYPGCYNLSLSHGYCGVLLVMLELITKKENNKELEKIVHDGISFLISHLSDTNFEKEIYCHSEIVIYPDNRPKGNSRLAWCYGDLNIALLLLNAGKILKKSEYTDLGTKIGLTTLQRKGYLQTYIKDSHFCHGTSGIAQIYFRFYQITNNKRFLDGRNFWLKKTLEFLESFTKSGQYDEGDERAKLLDGLPGVSLVLLSFKESQNLENLNWDYIFLLS